jgi:hypothetical protein
MLAAFPGRGGAHRDVDQGRQLRGVRDHLVVLGDVLEQAVQVDLLLVCRAQHAGLLHAGDRQHRGVVEFGVVEPVEQVDAARPGGRQAHPDPAGRLGVGRGHEGRRLLVVHQHEPDLVGLAAQPFHDPVDAVPGYAVDGVDAPLGKPGDHGFGCDLTHRPGIPECGEVIQPPG